MKKITLPEFVEAIQPFFPVGYQMVLEWAESGHLPCVRNPFREQAYYRVKADEVEWFCRHCLQLKEGQITVVLTTLGIAETKQTSMF